MNPDQKYAFLQRNLISSSEGQAPPSAPCHQILSKSVCNFLSNPAETVNKQTPVKT